MTQTDSQRCKKSAVALKSAEYFKNIVIFMLEKDTFFEKVINKEKSCILNSFT